MRWNFKHRTNVKQGVGIKSPSSTGVFIMANLRKYVMTLKAYSFIAVGFSQRIKKQIDKGFSQNNYLG